MTMSAFAQRLGKILDARGMSRADLSRATGIPYHRLNPWFIRPASKPSAPDLLAVADYLGVSQEFLMGGPGDEAGPSGPSDTEQQIRSLVSQLPDALRRQLLGYAQALAASQDNQTQESPEESE